MSILALVYRKQYRWIEAERLEKTTKMILGVDDPDTLARMSSLAHTWKALGQETKAIDLLRICVEKQRQILGPDHPDTQGEIETLGEWEIELEDV
ncbi:hypothetical protein N7456_010216 [Penicillium angulare]|uniref:Kinesin light chain n=1 Tax=Penicillium angulare TaxID=116970 RepID=A0A9W9F674_9EURO|nr:hypothetical protein N7456_010216 [Penicillium angulare]